MHIQRIQVPNFRVLQDVDITFEKDFVPCIFPLGSLNGGGKSTLLQLIFVLLHCSAHENRKQYIQNMLEGFDVPEGESASTLAKFEIWDGQDIIELEFFCCDINYFRDSFSKYEKQSIEDKKIKNDLDSLLINLDRGVILPKLGKIEDIGNYHLAKIRNTFNTQKQSHKEDFYKLATSLEDFINNKLSLTETKKTNDFYITHYLTQHSSYFLMCRCINIDLNYEVFWGTIETKIYLSAPITQMYLFLPKTSKSLLFQTAHGQEQNNYFSKVKELQASLPNFFNYDFVGVAKIIEALDIAMRDDMKIMVETLNSKRGNNFETILESLRKFFPDKEVLPTIQTVENKSEIRGIKFIKKGSSVELYPEDLSHGELKKLSLYIWLKYHNIKDAIVLIDEVENNFHPDWQYQITDNLRDWGETNQFILATHSYDVCQALTPAHVKELEPKLLKNG